MAAKTGSATKSWIPDTCTAADLGRLLGINPRNVRDWAAKGVLVRTSNSKYKTLESLHAYHSHLREQAAGRATSGGRNLADEKADLARVQRELAEMKLAKERGETLTLDEVRDSWSMFAQAVKSTVLALPTQMRNTIPHLTAHDGETIRRLCRDKLEDLAQEVKSIVVGGNPSEISDGE